MHGTSWRSTSSTDPEAKKGIVGAFCRAYPIIEAIETFLKEEYEPVDGGRYTYIKGTTAAGLLTYEDNFAYSGLIFFRFSITV